MIELEFFKSSKCYRELIKDINNNFLSHCYLLIGEDDYLINKFANFFACAISCDDNPACFSCNQCKSFLNGYSTDIEIYPKEANFITVKDAINVVNNAHLMPLNSKYKIFILKNIDQATIQAQNKLLKTLEDAPQTAIFILTSTSEQNILHTVISRTKKIYVEKLNEQQFEKYLDFQRIKNREFINLSDRNLSIYNKFIENPNLAELYKISNEVFYDFKNSVELLEYSNRILKYKNNIEDFLYFCMNALENLCLVKTDKIQVHNDYLERLNKVSDDYSFVLIKNLFIQIEESVKKIKANCNVVGVVDGLLLNILEEKYNAKSGRY